MSRPNEPKSVGEVLQIGESSDMRQAESCSGRARSLKTGLVVSDAQSCPETMHFSRILGHEVSAARWCARAEIGSLYHVPSKGPICLVHIVLGD